MNTMIKVARYQLAQPVLFLAVPWAALAFVFAVNAAQGGGGNFRDGLVVIFWMFFVAGTSRIGRWLPFGLALGATRRSFYAGTALLGVSLSLVSGLAITVLQAIERATGGWGLSITFFRVPYVLNGPWYATWLTSFVGLSALFVYGMWYGIVNRRWGTLGLLAFVAVQVLVALAVAFAYSRAGAGPLRLRPAGQPVPCHPERPRADRRHRRADGSVSGRRPGHDPPRHGVREPRPAVVPLAAPADQSLCARQEHPIMTVKTALITGTSRPAGLGFAVARQLAELGYHVVLTARDVSRAEPLAEQLREDGLAATALRLDLADEASMHDAAGYLTRTFGRLDALVNNAADMPDFGTLSALDADMGAVRSAMEIDVIGPWALVQSMLPLLTAAPAARVVNVSSLSSQQVATGLDLGAPMRAPAYSMAKYMLDALTTVLARALADTPVLVNAVDPGNTATHPERGDDENDRPAAESARDIVWAATLGPDGPTGGLFRDGQPVSENNMTDTETAAADTAASTARR